MVFFCFVFLVFVFVFVFLTDQFFHLPVITCLLIVANQRSLSRHKPTWLHGKVLTTGLVNSTSNLTSVDPAESMYSMILLGNDFRLNNLLTYIRSSCSF